MNPLEKVCTFFSFLDSGFFLSPTPHTVFLETNQMIGRGKKRKLEILPMQVMGGMALLIQGTRTSSTRV
jgi:hypothetical protein